MRKHLCSSDFQTELSPVDIIAAWIVRATFRPSSAARAGAFGGSLLRRLTVHRQGDMLASIQRPFALGFLFLCSGRPYLHLFEQGRCRVARATRSLIRGGGVQLHAAPRGSGL